MSFFAESPANASFRKNNLHGISDQRLPEIQGLRMPSLAKIIENRTGKKSLDLVQQQTIFQQLVHKLQEAGLETIAIQSREQSTQDMDEGELLPIHELTRLGTNPSQIILYRITDPSNSPKPERMWTTDVDTFLTMYEIDPNGKIVIVSSLAEVAEAGDGVVLDHMDTNGVSVRQINESEFPPEAIWGSVEFKTLF